MKKFFVFLFLFSTLSMLSQSGFEDQTVFTRKDSLRGSLTPERVWWNVKYYDLSVTVNPDDRYISGKNTITYQVESPHQIMQIDLQQPMKIDSIIQDHKKISFQSEGNHHFLELVSPQSKGEEKEITIYFSGKPKVARRPPWDGGFTWTKDSNGIDFIANANQGIGASVWWPLKDHPTEEPDRGMRITVTTPKHLMDVSNGRLINTTETETTKTWTWEVVNPINAYGVNISIADYVHFGEKYKGEAGELSMDYYVLRENEEKARKQFKQAPMMIEAFEHWYGPYPFYEDGYKLIEVPYLGMEHQSSVTYGNHYENGYLGSDLSGSGWGLKFDFILIHESAHEWFANSITNHDVADMWVHEGFTCYSENLYLDYHFGKEASSAYVTGLRSKILNDRPMIGVYGVDYRGSSDIYYKGANILHTVRQLVNDDEKWREVLRKINKNFYHQIVTSKQIEEFIAKEIKMDLTAFWDQYLRTTQIPKLEFQVDKKVLKFRYTDVIEGFDMPVVVFIDGKEHWIHPSSDWKTKKFPRKIEKVEVKKDFYVTSERVQ